MPPAPDSSARISNNQTAPRFTAPAENYPAGNTEKKLSGSGYSEKLSGSGYQLPDLENVQWESNGLGGWEAWHVPDGITHRAGKTYLGFLGKRRLAQLEKETPESFAQIVADWIAEKRSEKRIE